MRVMPLAIRTKVPTHTGTAPFARASAHLRGMSLVELLIVLVIIAALMLLLSPALGRSMRQASAAVCMHNLRELDRALQAYRLDNRGVLPDVVDPAGADADDPYGQAWYGRLVPKYLNDRSVLICPADPARGSIDTAVSLDHHPDPANVSSYGMNDLIRVAGLENIERNGPSKPLETILLADAGPDSHSFGSQYLSRQGGRLPWDDSYHPGLAGLTRSWLTDRHFGHINVLAIGGAVQRVNTSSMMAERVVNFYPDCASGGCTLCTGHAIAHYSFAAYRLFWWTGPLFND